MRLVLQSSFVAPKLWENIFNLILQIQSSFTIWEVIRGILCSLYSSLFCTTTWALHTAPAITTIRWINCKCIAAILTCRVFSPTCWTPRRTSSSRRRRSLASRVSMRRLCRWRHVREMALISSATMMIGTMMAMTIGHSSCQVWSGGRSVHMIHTQRSTSFKCYDCLYNYAQWTSRCPSIKPTVGNFGILLAWTDLSRGSPSTQRWGYSVFPPAAVCRGLPFSRNERFNTSGYNIPINMLDLIWKWFGYSQL